MELRPYQKDARQRIVNAWANAPIRLDDPPPGLKPNVLCVMPTGAGKTVLMSNIVASEPDPVCVIAHRQELVSQISLALARNEVRHKIIGPLKVIRFVVSLHVQELGKSYIKPNANVAVAGVDTLVRREHELKSWSSRVRLWLIDEAHHVQVKNKWGASTRMFPNARGLGVTATPVRADGCGLGRDTHGVFDCMVIGPTMRDLMSDGYLTPYRIFAPTTDQLNLKDVSVSKSTGDYSADKLRKAVRKSRIVGDVVDHYQRLAPGKLGITFATDVQIATEIAEKFNSAGVPAAVVSAKTPDAERVSLVEKFRKRELLQLVNVDLFGEGFDLPAIEVVSMARPTKSFALFSQQFGRSLRPLAGKSHAIIIDHVGNVLENGLPDDRNDWTLEPFMAKTRRGPGDAISLKTCEECAAVYEAYRVKCTECGFKPVPQGPEIQFVDGDLTEMTPESLNELLKKHRKANLSIEEERARLASRFVPHIGQLAGAKRHARVLELREIMRETIDQWAGALIAQGYSEAECYRLFYHRFGHDVISAQTLKLKETHPLLLRIEIDYFKEAANVIRRVGA